MRPRFAFGWFVLAVLATDAVADESGGTESPFMLGTGARPLAMGGAAVALTSDAEALFWNPSRLAFTERGDFSLFRTKLFVDGATYHSGFLTYPTTDLGTLALGYQRIGVDEIERRDDRNALLGSFENSESNLLLGYGREIQPGLALGANLRIAQQKVGEASGLGIGLDLAGSWTRALDAASTHRVGVGINFQNLIEPKIRLEEEDVPDPFRLRVGTAYRGHPRDGKLSWALSGDLDLPSTAEARVGIGAEIGLDEVLFLRGGLDHGRPTFGFGLQQRGIRFDYAMVSHDELSRSDRFSLSIRFGSGVAERRVARQRAAEDRVRLQLTDQLEKRTNQALEIARRDARAAFDDGRYEEAVRLYRQVTLYAPDDEDAPTQIREAELRQSLARADAELAQGEAARAAAEYEAILRRWPGQPTALAGLARAQEALQIASDRDRQLNSLFSDALASFSEGEFWPAAQLLDQLLRLSPEHTLGRELLDRVHAMRRAAGEDDLQIARQLAEREDYTRALTRLRSARKNLPDREDLAGLDRDWRTAAERKRQEEERARREREALRARQVEAAQPVRRALSSADRDRLDAQLREGLRAFQAGDFDGAIRRWQSVWNERSDYENVGQYLVKAYLYQGIHLYSQGEYERALERCQRVLEIEPGHEKALRYLARIQEERLEVEELGRRAR